MDLKPRQSDPKCKPTHVTTVGLGRAAWRWFNEKEEGMQAPTTAVAPQTCSWCGSAHVGKCPKVKAIEYHPDGTVKRVEFHDWAVR